MNKVPRWKTFRYFTIQINNEIVEGLVDTNASKFVMIVNMVCKFGLMHLVTSSKMYKSSLGVITQTIGENRQAYEGWQQIVINLYIYLFLT
jgi:hypothetical protein